MDRAISWNKNVSDRARAQKLEKLDLEIVRFDAVLDRIQRLFPKDFGLHTDGTDQGLHV